MPVDDHPVHERTIEKPGTKWGCWNAERQPGYWVPTRTGNLLHPLRMEYVEDRSSKECATAKNNQCCSKCEGCKEAK